MRDGGATPDLPIWLITVVIGALTLCTFWRQNPRGVCEPG